MEYGSVRYAKSLGKFVVRLIEDLGSEDFAGWLVLNPPPPPPKLAQECSVTRVQKKKTGGTLALTLKKNDIKKVFFFLGVTRVHSRDTSLHSRDTSPLAQLHWRAFLRVTVSTVQLGRSRHWGGKSAHRSLVPPPPKTIFLVTWSVVTMPTHKINLSFAINFCPTTILRLILCPQCCCLLQIL